MSLASLSTLIQNAWVAYSLWASLGLAGGALLVVAALMLSGWLPGFLRTGLLVAGVALIAGAALYQAGTAEGAHDAFAAEAARALAAEKARAATSQYITDRIATQAARDLEVLSDSNKRLKELNDALAQDLDRDRPCVDRDTARRLREL